MVVHVCRWTFAIAAPTLGWVGHIGYRDLRHDPFTDGAIKHVYIDHHSNDVCRFGFGGVTLGDVHSAHVIDLLRPDERETQSRLPEAAGIDGVFRNVLHRMHGLFQKPTAIQPLRLRRAHAMPVTVPDFDPGMISTLVDPTWCPRHARRNTDRAAGVHQQNGQARAGRHATLHRFKRSLIRNAPLR
jgi:hypothetical protein